jgi:hypothetical protein
MEKLLLIVKLIPALIELIKAIEAAIPGQGKGEQKLAAVREILEVTDKGISAIWPTVASVVGVLVQAMNSTGGIR